MSTTEATATLIVKSNDGCVVEGKDRHILLWGMTEGERKEVSIPTMKQLIRKLLEVSRDAQLFTEIEMGMMARVTLVCDPLGWAIYGYAADGDAEVPEDDCDNVIAWDDLSWYESVDGLRSIACNLLRSVRDAIFERDLGENSSRFRFDPADAI